MYKMQHFLVDALINYIVCSGTTEKIFEFKTQLFDIYVDNQNVTTHVPALKEVIRMNSADKDKFKKLNMIRCSVFFTN